MPIQTPIEVNGIVDPILLESIQGLNDVYEQLGGMAGYHLGFYDQEFKSVPQTPHLRGKRVRPKLALLSCDAVSGSPNRATFLAAAIEMLHQFTLIHDDIQDRSRTRRSRPTVWSIWGKGQAINAGDALFSESFRLLLRSGQVDVDPILICQIAHELSTTTAEIVGGQVMDLTFEGHPSITPTEYLTMIERKTGALLAFSARSGALIAGAGEELASQFGAFGYAFGVGFQMRDDYLGIWGESDQTGKSNFDDLRQGKRSYPIVLLRDRLNPVQRKTFDKSFRPGLVDDSQIESILSLLDEYAVRAAVEELTVERHEQMLETVRAIQLPPSPSLRAMSEVVSEFSTRVR